MAQMLRCVLAVDNQFSTLKTSIYKAFFKYVNETLGFPVFL